MAPFRTLVIGFTAVLAVLQGTWTVAARLWLWGTVAWKPRLSMGFVGYYRAVNRGDPRAIPVDLRID